MAHWRDGGIGNMPGMDVRPFEERTLLERLAAMGASDQTAQDAFDEIQRLREGWGLAGFPTWESIDTAPVEPYLDWDPTARRFKCLLQTRHGDVFEGCAGWVKLGKMPRLRWYRANGRQAFPKYWMPLPAPKDAELAQTTENGAIA